MELMIAMAIMVLALLALMSSVFSSSRLVDNSKEKTLAYEAARAKIEEMRNYTGAGSFEQLFTYYSLTANKTTVVSGLNARKIAGVDQPVLEIFFPVNASGNLTENPTSPPMDSNILAAMGMPKDLNWNGNTTDAGGTLNTEYKILPFVIRVQWRSTGSKDAFIDVGSFISSK